MNSHKINIMKIIKYGEHNGMPKLLASRPELQQWYHSDQAVGIMTMQNTARLISQTCNIVTQI